MTTRQYSPKVEAQRQTHRDLLGTSRTDLDVLLVASPDQIFRVASLDDALPPPAKDLPKLSTVEKFLFFPDESEHCLHTDGAPAFPAFIVFYNLENASLRPQFLATHQKLSASLQHARYCFRHAAAAPSVEAALPRVLAQGYEAVLSLKSLEYKAINQPAHDDPQGSDAGSASPGRTDGSAVDPDLVVSQFEALNVTALPNLGHLAVQSLQGSQHFLEDLIHMTQNFPLVAPSIAAQTLRNATLIKISSFATDERVQPGTELLLLNGRPLDLKTLDPYSLHAAVSAEEALLRALAPLPLQDSSKYAIPFLSSGHPSQKTQLRFDIRSPYIHWLNDLQRDEMYESLPRSLSALLQMDPFNPFRAVRKNALSLVFFWPASDIQSLHIFGQIAQGLSQGLPIRLGVVVVSSLPASHPSHTAERDFAHALLSIFSSKNGLYEKLQTVFTIFHILRDSERLEEAHVNQFVEYTGVRVPSDKMDLVLSASNAFVSSLGFSRQQSSLFLNGMMLSSSGNFFQDLMMKATYVEYPLLGSLITEEHLTAENTKKSDDIYNYILSTASVLPRFNAELLEHPLVVVDLDLLSLRDLQFAYLTDPSAQEASIQKLTYLICADLDTAQGVSLAYFAMSQLDKRLLSSDIRVALVDLSGGSNAVWRAIQAAIQSHSPFALDTAQKFVNRFLLRRLDDLAALSDEAEILQLAEKHLRWPQKFKQLFHSEALTKIGETQTAFALDAECTSGDIILNGRFYHLLPSQLEQLERADLDFLDAIELGNRVHSIFGRGESSFLETLEFSSDIDIDDQTAALRSDILISILSILRSSSSQNQRRRFSPDADFSYSSHAAHRAKFAFQYILDPLDGSASRVLPLLQTMLSLNDPSDQVSPLFSLDIALLPAMIEKLPLQKFSRYVIGQPAATTSAASSSSTLAAFDGLPQSRLLTLQLNHPHSWLVQTTYAKYDLDNLILKQVTEDTLIAKYQLDHLLFQGSCADAKRVPPQGLQMTLSLNSNAEVYSDTLVMINFGYFQLKANPGLWTLRMAPGRAQQLYSFAGEVEETPVAITSWSGLDDHPLQVAKRPGLEALSLVDVDSAVESIEVKEEPSLWNTLTDMLSSGNSGAVVPKNQTIHIFSLASGHLYERFLKIMILSVLNHTQSPVKFWLLQNYLSPDFKALLPKMAAHFGFEFEFVTFQWPVWLRAQTEKQRVMWAYKILFLDVLFPLSLDRIIFVDADQIVRADLKELMELDLHGAPYAYTPFCDSRQEMDGFRFWKQGFWDTHLRGRPYHISALYVVDLKRFRRIAAGDQLRATYDGLSADPNSLANLDQDLPNYLQSLVRIYSLPAEWLWCETWCDDASLSTAKTIDLCNNPLTKAGKLQTAARIIPEWKTYDEIVENFK